MSDSALAKLFFCIGLLLTVVSLVLGPFGIENWSVSIALVACFFAVTGIYLAMQGWDEKPRSKKPQVGLEGDAPALENAGASEPEQESAVSAAVAESAEEKSE